MINGALVGDVIPNSPADKAGFKSGDVMLEFNGKKIADSRAISSWPWRETKPGAPCRSKSCAMAPRRP